MLMTSFCVCVKDGVYWCKILVKSCVTSNHLDVIFSNDVMGKLSFAYEFQQTFEDLYELDGTIGELVHWTVRIIAVNQTYNAVATVPSRRNWLIILLFRPDEHRKTRIAKLHLTPGP